MNGFCLVIWLAIQKKIDSVESMVNGMQERMSEEYKECESGIRKTIADYVRSYNKNSE